MCILAGHCWQIQLEPVRLGRYGIDLLHSRDKKIAADVSSASGMYYTDIGISDLVSCCAALVKWKHEV